MTQKAKAAAFDRMTRHAQFMARVWLIESNSQLNSDVYRSHSAVKSQIYIEILQESGAVCCICDVCRSYVHNKRSAG